mmetsp:Transcript_38973/g.77386  ORF Transcript_38973/g.77386 Transcript_38973/m.77386 type:complete len:204 (-) Transcript_38973:145-756(-)
MGTSSSQCSCGSEEVACNGESAKAYFASMKTAIRHPPSLDDCSNPAMQESLINQDLLRAAMEGKADEVRESVRRGAYVDTRRPFYMAVETSFNGMEPESNMPGLTPLMHAVLGGHDKACRELILLKADVNAAEEEDGYRPLHFAVQAGHQDLCRELLVARADPSATDDSGLTAFGHVMREDGLTKADKLAWQELLHGKCHARV